MAEFHRGALKRGLAVLCLVACVLVLRMAHAAPQLQYQVSEGCPNQRWFERELAAQEIPKKVNGRLQVSVSSSEEQPGVFVAAAQYDIAEQQASTPAAQPVAADALAESVSAADPGSRARAPRAEWQRGLSGPSCEELLAVLAVAFAVYVESRDDSLGPYLLPEDEPLPPLVQPAWFDPPKLDYVASATWRLGLIAGLDIRTGLAPSATGSWLLAIHLRGVRPGWGAGPFQLGFGADLGPDRHELPVAVGSATTWIQNYWTVHVLACPWMAAPSTNTRLGPALGVHGGRFGASLPAIATPNDDDEVWFAFYELMLLGEMQRGPMLARIQLGLQFPVSPYRVAEGPREVYHQQAGLVMGLGLGWSGVLL